MSLFFRAVTQVSRGGRLRTTSVVLLRRLWGSPDAQRQLLPGTDLEPKSVPDFESVGAMWAPVEALRQLEDSDYRSPDPPRLYPKVSMAARCQQQLCRGSSRGGGRNKARA